MVRVTREDFLEEVTFSLRLNDENKPEVQSESKCFSGLRDSKNSGFQLGDDLVSPVTREGHYDQSLESKGEGHAMRLEHQAGTGLHSTFQATVGSLDLALSSTGSH